MQCYSPIRSKSCERSRPTRCGTNQTGMLLRLSSPTLCSLIAGLYSSRPTGDTTLSQPMDTTGRDNAVSFNQPLTLERKHVSSSSSKSHLETGTNKRGMKRIASTRKCSRPTTGLPHRENLCLSRTCVTNRNDSLSA